jgi:shikimate kinase
MGSGKSTVGRLLARHLGWRWVDLDLAIERRAGKKIARIFETQGEAAFRRLESRELALQAKRVRQVISCGGGVVLAPKNRGLLKRSLTLYLAISPEAVARRLRGPEAQKRPLLTGRPALAVLRRLQRERARFYRASARIVLRASSKPSAVAERAFNRLRSTLTP